MDARYLCRETSFWTRLMDSQECSAHEQQMANPLTKVKIEPGLSVPGEQQSRTHSLLAFWSAGQFPVN